MNLYISKINTKKNLLAFSAGVDSTALFFLLLEQNIPFDLAIVNYNIREQAKEELEYAKELALKYKKKIYIKELHLDANSNFEKKARDIRYDFFDQIINEENYDTLITAHQLNDALEWFLMQFTKGAGLTELISFDKITQRANYLIYRPLLDITKDTLQKYLENKGIKYFVDITNFDVKYKRNHFRKNFSNELLNQFEEGIKKSFQYLRKDINSLNINDKPILEEKDLEVFKNLQDDNLNIRIIDFSLKRRGILLTKAQRDEILKQKEIVVSHKFSIAITSQYIFISPYVDATMDKEFKEKCRKNKIPKNIRTYIFIEQINSIFNLMV